MDNLMNQKMIDTSHLTPIEIALGIDEKERLPRDFWDELLKVTDFESFFICISKMKIRADSWQLHFLGKLVNMFAERYSWSAIVYLRDDIDLEFAHWEKGKQGNHSEHYYQNKIIEKFEDVFPKYDYIGKEIKVEKIGRIDILARDKKSGRHVIIECKKGRISAVKQLIAYSQKYKASILISITEDEIPKKNRHPQIKYYTYSELGIV